MARYPKDMLEHMLAAMRPGEPSTPPPPSSPPSKSGGEPPRPRPAKKQRSHSPGSGGPFAPFGSGSERPKRPAAPAAGEARPVRDLLLQLGPARLAVIQVLLLLAAFLLGRASRPIRAAGPEQGPIEAALADPAADLGGETRAAADPAPRRPDPDAALKDPRNRFTIVAVTYGDTAEQRDLARATHAHLRTSGLPVFRPYLHRGKVLLLVGAAPRESDLTELRDRLRALESPRGRPEFQDAYVVAIGDYIQR